MESIKIFFVSKEAYPIVRQLEKITVKKAEAKVVKCAKNKSWVLGIPLGHLSGKGYCTTKLSMEFVHYLKIINTVLKSI